jgi:hypothetical protein
MHVRGYDGAPDVVAHILSELGLCALDGSSESGFFEHDPVLRAKSFGRWKSFLSRVSENVAAQHQQERENDQ